MVNLTNVVCVLTAPLTGHSPVSLPLLGSPCILKHSNIEIGLINNPPMASKFSSERESHMPVTFYQKLKMIKLSEKSMSKDETG